VVLTPVFNGMRGPGAPADVTIPADYFAG